MTDIAAVLDAAATAVAGAGKPDVKALGQAGKHAASFCGSGRQDGGAGYGCVAGRR